MRKGGGFGMLVLLAAVLIVLLLVARAWSNMAPQALQVSDPAGALAVESVDGDAETSYTSPGHLPDLQEMNQATAQHEEQVREAMEQTP